MPEQERNPFTNGLTSEEAQDVHKSKLHTQQSAPYHLLAVVTTSINPVIGAEV